MKKIIAEIQSLELKLANDAEIRHNRKTRPSHGPNEEAGHRPEAGSDEEAATKSGPGSRGGKVIGKTRSGKPIYAARGDAALKSSREKGDNYQKNDALHKDYSLEDHIDALAFHRHNKPSTEVNKKLNWAHDRGEHYHDKKIGEMTNDYKFTPEHKAMAAKSEAHYRPKEKKAAGYPPNSTHHYIQQIEKNVLKLKPSKEVDEVWKTYNGLDMNSGDSPKLNRALRVIDNIFSKMVDAQNEHKQAAEEGPRGGKIIGKTRSGKPIYDSHGNRNHKGFTKKDHLDAAQHHQVLRQMAQNENEKQHNGDGTYSKQHAKRSKQLKKVMEHHHSMAHRHLNSMDPAPKQPDQKDWDREDRKNDPQQRAKSWGTTAAVWHNVVTAMEEKGKIYFDWGGRVYEFSNDKLKEMAAKTLRNWKNPHLGVNFKDYGHIVPKVPKGVQIHDSVSQFGNREFWEKFAATKADKRAKWMAAMEKSLLAKAPTMAGKIDWDTAVYLFNTGITPEDAAERMAKKASRNASTGPRGGNIIGHTKSGKAIYDVPTHANTDIASWTNNDHHDAMLAHEKESDKHHHTDDDLATQHAATARFHENLSKKSPRPSPQHGGELSKQSNETGPRGGKIIGKTKSGKPIYDIASHPSHKGFSKDEHLDAMDAHTGKISEIRAKHGLGSPDKDGARVNGPDSMKEAFHSVQWNNHDKASGYAGTKRPQWTDGTTTPKSKQWDAEAVQKQNDDSGFGGKR